MKPRTRSFALVLAGLALSASAAPGVIQGRVVDDQTRSGVEGAFVYARWIRYGPDGFAGKDSCRQASVVKTDAGGAYSIPSGPWGTKVSVQAYKPGLEELAATDAAGGGKLHRMTRLSSPKRRQLDLIAMGGLFGCRIPDAPQVLTPLYQTAEDEAMRLGLSANLMQMLKLLDSTVVRKGGP